MKPFVLSLLTHLTPSGAGPARPGTVASREVLCCSALSRQALLASVACGLRKPERQGKAVPLERSPRFRLFCCRLGLPLVRVQSVPEAWNILMAAGIPIA